MSEYFEYFKYLFNPEWIFLKYGSIALFIVLAIVFAETGLFIGFFLPGDSLLFTAGVFSKYLTHSFYNIHFSLITLMVATSAILGNIFGYWFGYKSGPLLFKKQDSFFFKKRHLIIAKIFFTKYKTISLLISRFLPILRTFSPIIAGIFRINFKHFMIYNIIGGLAWTFSIMMAGNYLDKIFPSLKEHLEIIILNMVLFTTMPIIIKFFLKKNIK